MGKRLTEEEYIDRLDKFFPNIKLIGNYTNHATKTLHRCLIHNCDWEVTPNHILRGEGCHQCGVDKSKKSKTKTHEKYVDELSKKSPNIEVIDKYIKASIKITHRCKICGHIWRVEPSSILHGTGCPVCAGSICGGAPKYINSIWASKYKDFFSQYLTDEQMKIYMPHSNTKIDVVCPHCQRHKKIAPNAILFSHGIGCVCSDGISYPNKFIYSLLDQLKVDYEPEYVFDWAKDKRYDVYIHNLNCIIENHGGQHYDKGFLSMDGKTLQEEKENDIIKQNLAIQNGIKYYIVLDCRKSDVDWIKKSVLSSELNNLFDLSLVDFCKCSKFACSNLVKTVADLWNDGLSVKDIVLKTGLPSATVQHYLIKASKSNMCDWTPQKSHKRGAEMHSGEKHHMARMVVQYNKNNNVIKIWKYAKQASNGLKTNENIKINDKNIIACCRGKRITAGGYQWKYLYDQTCKDGTIISGAITLGLITEEEALNILEKQNDIISS